MYAVASFLIVASISVAFTQAVTGALVATGLPIEIAKFQARSAFSGAGFTTTESENIVNHHVRRKIISFAMFMGNLGTPTLVVTVVIGFLEPGPGSAEERIFVIVAGTLAILMLLTNRPVKRLLRRVGANYGASQLEPVLQVGFDELIDLGDDFVVGTVRVEHDPGTTFRSIRGLDAAIDGASVLGVRHGGEYHGARPADLGLTEGDELVLYGKRDTVAAHVGVVAHGRHHLFRSPSPPDPAT